MESREEGKLCTYIHFSSCISNLYEGLLSSCFVVMCKKENDTLDKYQDSPTFVDREEMRDNVVRKGSSLVVIMVYYLLIPSFLYGLLT
jgi:hypothetical protein